MVKISTKGMHKVCLVKGVCVEYSYMRSLEIRYHTAVFPPLFTEEKGYIPYTDDQLKGLVFERYGHIIKSIINVTIL